MSTTNDQENASNPGVRRLSVTHFLIALILLLASVPFIDRFPDGELVESILLTVVMLSAVFAVGGQKRTLFVASILVLPAVGCKWVQHFWPGAIPRDVTDVAAIVFIAYIIVHLFRFILRAPRVNDEILHAALATYLMLGVLWMFTYMWLSRYDPGAFQAGSPSANHTLSSHEALFLSLGTLSNVGFDEVRAASKSARLLMITEGMTGIFYIAIIISRLVAMYTGNEERKTET